jgi:predicted N-acyltransferase
VAGSTTLRVLDGIAGVPRATWDALLDGDPEANPFVSWDFLHALEDSGCAAPARGWRPRHLTLWRDRTLIAAAPTYAKSDHEGDFARDWVWSSFVERLGVRYFPRLLITVPITPVGGRRILCAAGEDRAACTTALIAGARALAAEERYSSVHVLYACEDDLAHLERAGMALRMDFQAMWFNHGYTSPADFLARGMNSKTRNLVRREKAQPAAQGITIRTVRGAEIAADRAAWGTRAHGFYQATIDKMRWGRPWLNRGFYERIFEHMPGPLELVVAEREGRYVAGAFNVQHGSRLFGRYWGCHEEHDFLHFNVCLHHSVDDCIQRGLQVFEGGAGGEHKLHRGFDLGATASSHWFREPRIDAEIKRFLHQERQERAAELAKWQNVKRKKPTSQNDQAT